MALRNFFLATLISIGSAAAQNVPAPAGPVQPAALTALNNAFRAAYADAKTRVLAASGPTLIVNGDTFVLLRDGRRVEANAATCWAMRRANTCLTCCRNSRSLTRGNRTATVIVMATPEPDPAGVILDLERAALERWGRGDPDGFLEISADEVSYFDPFTQQRLDGIDALRAWYEQVRGKIHIDRFEIVDPRVQAAGDMAVLSYRFDSRGSEGSMRWNTTEVYRRGADGWRIVHTHWAFHRPA